MATRNFPYEWFEVFVLLVVLVVLTVMGGTMLYEYIEKARLTLSLDAMNRAQEAFRRYRTMHRSFPTTFDFRTCSDQDHTIVLSCDEIKGDINGFVSYHGSADTFILKAKAKDSKGTIITITESTKPN